MLTIPLSSRCWQDAHRLEFTPVMLQLAERARLRDLFSVGDAARYFLSLLQSDGSSGDLEGSSSSRDAARHFLSLLESDGSSGDLEGSSSSSGVDPDQGSSSDESESDDEGRRALRHKPF